jgi:hypothetical protein
VPLERGGGAFLTSALEGLAVGDAESELSGLGTLKVMLLERGGDAFLTSVLEGLVIGDAESELAGLCGTLICGVVCFGEPSDLGTALTIALEESAVGEDTTSSFSDVGGRHPGSELAVAATLAFLILLFFFAIATSSEVSSRSQLFDATSRKNWE